MCYNEVEYSQREINDVPCLPCEETSISLKNVWNQCNQWSLEWSKIINAMQAGQLIWPHFLSDVW